MYWYTWSGVSGSHQEGTVGTTGGVAGGGVAGRAETDGGRGGVAGRAETEGGPSQLFTMTEGEAGGAGATPGISAPTCPPSEGFTMTEEGAGGAGAGGAGGTQGVPYPTCSPLAVSAVGAEPVVAARVRMERRVRSTLARKSELAGSAVCHAITASRARRAAAVAEARVVAVGPVVVVVVLGPAADATGKQISIPRRSIVCPVATRRTGRLARATITTRTERSTEEQT